jgi:hypothetical protein
LCFSASSHFTWVDEGLPVIAPDADGMVRVNDARCDIAGAVRQIEDILAGYPIRPFFGSTADHELPLTGRVPGARVQRAALVQTGRFAHLVVADPSGQRQCIIEGRYVTFSTEPRMAARWPTRQLAARAIWRDCEGSEAAADIVADRRRKSGVTASGSDGWTGRVDDVGVCNGWPGRW